MASTVSRNRIPPNNIEAEKSVLGCCLSGEKPLAQVTAYLQSADFYQPSHRLIYDIMCELFIASRPVDTLTVSDALDSKGQLENCGGMQYIAGLPDAAPLVSRALDYAELVRSKAVLRRLLTAMDEVTSLAYEEQDDADALLDIAQQKIYAIRQGQDVSGMERLGDVMSRTVNEISALAMGKEGSRGVKTGYPSLDSVLGGLGRGTLNILAARPGMGKSALALNIAHKAATMYDVTSAIFSLEMSKEEIASRFLSFQAHIDSRALRTGQIQPSDWTKLSNALPILYNSKIFIDDSSSSSPLEMLSRCRQLKMEQNLGLVVIDYLQLMSIKGKGDNRQQEISEISRSLKMMARELDIPVIALSQLSRAVEQRDNKRPILSDLRESGSIEQDADTVMFLYRPTYYEHDHLPQELEEAELQVAKNRAGSTRSIKLGWMPSYTLFVDVTPGDAPDAYSGNVDYLPPNDYLSSPPPEDIPFEL